MFKIGALRGKFTTLPYKMAAKGNNSEAKYVIGKQSVLLKH